MGIETDLGTVYSRRNVGMVILRKTGFSIEASGCLKAISTVERAGDGQRVRLAKNDFTVSGQTADGFVSEPEQSMAALFSSVTAASLLISAMAAVPPLTVKPFK